jgi:hypothetical protein
LFHKDSTFLTFCQEGNNSYSSPLATFYAQIKKRFPTTNNLRSQTARLLQFLLFADEISRDNAAHRVEKLLELFPAPQVPKVAQTGVVMYPRLHTCLL